METGLMVTMVELMVPKLMTVWPIEKRKAVLNLSLKLRLCNVCCSVLCLQVLALIVLITY